MSAAQVVFSVGAESILIERTKKKRERSESFSALLAEITCTSAAVELSLGIEKPILEQVRRSQTP